MEDLKPFFLTRAGMAYALGGSGVSNSLVVFG